MLALHVHLLTGRYAATAYNDREMAEWPPHPARLYSALVEALHATREDKVCAVEEEALDVLAALPPPEIHASAAHHRRVMTVFVPVNDQGVTDSASSSKKEVVLREAELHRASLPSNAPAKALARADAAVLKALEALDKQGRKDALPPSKTPKKNPAKQAMPWGRTKQPRTFPVVVPHSPNLAFVWRDAELSDELRGALERVASRVVRLGHSSSMVVSTVVNEPDALLDCEEPWVPDVDGSILLRVPQRGQRQALDAAFEKYKGDTPGRVMPARHVRYASRAQEAARGSTLRTGGRWFVYRLEGKSLPPARAAVAIAESVRGALLKYAPDSATAWLTGHADGRVFDSEHLAVLSLPFVGRPHADGHIRGVALSLPASVPLEAERELMGALGRWERASDEAGRRVRLWGREVSVWGERVVEPEQALHSLREDSWSRASRSWVTITPAALDGECPSFHHPKGSIRNKARKIATRLIQRAVARQIEAISGTTLSPEDVGVELDPGPWVEGAPHVARVPAFQRAGHVRPRRLVNARIELPFPVRGPLVIGSGRHFGLGLCWPITEEN